jgi:hypothetical protein
MMMDCFDTNQLALYLTTYGLGAKERRAYEQHLAKCQRCRDQVNRLQRRLRDLDVENQKACEGIRDSLEAYALGQLPDEARAKVLQHTGECHVCHAFLTRLSTFPDLQKVEAWEIPIPSHLSGNIEKALEKQFGRPPRKAEEKLREIAEGVKDFLKEIRLSLSPLGPAWGFRGEEEAPKSDFVEVEHAGGDLIVNVGVAGVIVELYSDREKYLDDGESDADGRVVFPEMKPGLYKIKVLGHKIEKMG